MTTNDANIYPVIPDYFIPRDQLVEMTINELKKSIPEQIVMSGKQNWKVWEELCNAKAYLGNLDITWIRSDELSDIMQAWLEEKDSRLVFINQPIVISGAPGYVFDEIICEIEFFSVSNDKKSALQKPTIELMLPASQWHTIFRWGGKLNFSVDNASNLVINSNFNPEIDIESIGLMPNDIVPSFFSIKVVNSIEVETGSKFIVPPFEYVIMRPLIRSDGKGSSIAKWFFGRGPITTPDSTGLLEQRPLMLGAFVRIPRNACLNIKTRMAARHHTDGKIPNFSSLVDTLQLVQKSIREFVLGGLPIVENTLNGYHQSSDEIEPLCEM